jgi:hypothetical protein
VAHVNRSGDTDKPFGSAFFHNSGRMTWHAKLEADIGGSTTVGLFNKKANIGPRSAPLGYRIDWGDRIVIARTDVLDIPDISQHVSIRYRVQAEVAAGAKTIAEIAASLDVGVDSVKKAVERDQKAASPAFVRVTGPDGIYRIGLRHVSGGDSCPSCSPLHSPEGTKGQDTGGLYPRVPPSPGRSRVSGHPLPKANRRIPIRYDLSVYPRRARSCTR